MTVQQIIQRLLCVYPANICTEEAASRSPALVSLTCNSVSTVTINRQVIDQYAIGTEVRRGY